MSEKEADLASARIERFTTNYRAWLVFALVIPGLLALSISPRSGIAFLLFVVVVWLVAWTLGKILIAVGWLLPQSFYQDNRKEIEDAVVTTLFFSAFAVLGIALRGDTFFKQWLAERSPIDIVITVIEPKFAVIIIVCSWAYAAYRIRR
ncbi:hypothetical protein [Dinoroseobacter sp. S76]|uniref:hypothetical protein n=1 Tax=Dinoroseobacter sp. S76 TaxID=3415124 RepID=UPI003C7D334D